MTDLRDPVALAAAYARGPQTATRVRKLLRLAKRLTPAEFQRLLAALPPAARVQVEGASVR